MCGRFYRYLLWRNNASIGSIQIATKVMEYKITLALDTLIADLGEEEAVDFVRFALPRLNERRELLHTLLLQEDWTAAALLAHKTLSSVRVYDDGSLEAALLTVERQAVAEISQAAFQQDLQDTFKRVLAGVEAWLGTIERNRLNSP